MEALDQQFNSVFIFLGFGDLFEQTYQYNEDNTSLCDVTLSAGPRLTKSAPLTSDVTDRCRAWYDSIASVLDSQPDDDVVLAPRVISLPTYDLCKSDKHCSLCKGVDAAPTEDQETAER